MLGIKDVSLQYRVAFMDRQTVTTLSASIPRDALLAIHADFLQEVRGATGEPRAAMRSLLCSHRGQNHQKAVNHIVQIIRSVTRQDMRQLKDVQRRLCTGVNQNKESGDGEDVRVRIPIMQSRHAFGAAPPPDFPEGALREGEVFFRPTIGGKPTVITGPLLLVRAPTYHPGDARVVVGVDLLKRPATQGLRPEPDKSGGGDLDGDQWDVYWDGRLTAHADKIRQHAPADYTKPKDLGRWSDG
eukprot:gene36472-53560_t